MAEEITSKKRPLKTYLVAGFGFLILLGILLGGNESKTAVKGTQLEPTVATGSFSEVQSSVMSEMPTSTPAPSFTSTPTPTVFIPTATLAPIQSSSLSNDDYYTNVDGDQVHSPAYSNSVPAGASAICGDGTYSFSQNRRGTCSHHGGVAQWL